MPDIICLQEHKLRLGRTDRIQKEVWRPAHWIMAPAADGAHANRNGRVESGKGGVALGISQDLRIFIKKEGILPGGRAAWACLEHPAWGRLGLVGVYGPNEREGRMELWSALCADLDPTFCWVLLGDLNMITAASDHKGGDGSIIRGREAKLWACLTRKFNLRDTFVADSKSLRFSWDNRRIHRHNPANLDFSCYGERTLRRLDKILMPTQSHTFPFAATSCILPGFAFSDHAPVIAWIKRGDGNHRPSGHRMNAAHLLNPAFRERIVELWEERKVKAAAENWTADKLFLSSLRGTRAVDRCWGKRRAEERKARLNSLRSNLARAQTALEATPTSIHSQAEVQVAVERLCSFEKEKASWVDQILQERWLADGDRGTTLFFKSFKNMATAKLIPALRAADGTLTSSWNSMADITVEFFQQTLGETSNSIPPPSIAADNPILDVVQDHLTADEKAILNAPFTVEELGAAAKLMKRRKCPGPDGIPIELFQEMWPVVGPQLTEILNEGIQREVFPCELTRGHIVLLPKKSDQSRLTNKRPITLLNAAYKIGAKALQQRLSPLLQKIITPEQFAFLPGRNIHHSLLLMGEMLHQAAISGEEYVFLKLYVIKAFDKLEWPFLLAVVEKMGIGGLLSRFLKAGFQSAASAIVLNGIPTACFSLKRSVRQGCPLSPLMFIMAFDVLSLQLQAAVVRKSIQGISFARIGVRTLHNMYADDLAALIRALLKYIEEFRRILTWFAELSGLYCDWGKTVAACIPAGPPPLALSHFPWKWEDNSTASPLLGVPMAQSVAQESLETSLIRKVESRISKYQPLALSFAARLLVANCMILGCLWYLLIMWAGKELFLRKLLRLVDRFVWNGRNRVARATVTLGKRRGDWGKLTLLHNTALSLVLCLFGSRCLAPTLYGKF